MSSDESDYDRGWPAKVLGKDKPVKHWLVRRQEQDVSKRDDLRSELLFCRNAIGADLNDGSATVGTLSVRLQMVLEALSRALPAPAKPKRRKRK